MSFTRIKDDDVRVKKSLEESVGPGTYMLSVPGNGMNPDYMEDPHIRLEKWGGNLDNNAIDLESDLRGMTRKTNRDEIPKNTHLTHEVDRIERNMSRLNSSATDQSRTTNPTWWHKEEQQYRPDILFYNPQDRIIPDFKSNTSSRIEQKNKF